MNPFESKLKKNVLFVKAAFISLAIIGGYTYPTCSYAQDNFETALQKKIHALAATINEDTELYPNDAPQSLMTPSGWGGWGTYLYGDMGGAYPEVYTANKVDLGMSAGISMGDPEKFVNVAVNGNMTDVHRFSDFSMDFSISRSLFGGSSISVGGWQLFANPSQSDAPEATFYVAFSHSVQTLPSKTPEYSKLTYTIGIGNGRFLEKSEFDIAAGKGKYGTAVFGAVSYEIFKNVNLNAEWDGMNLGFSFGVNPFKGPIPLSFGIGVTNLTSYSADKPTMIFSFGFPLSLNRNTL